MEGLQIRPTGLPASYSQYMMKYTLFVPALCKSAGTLMVTAAHTLILSPFGEIGPLDVQLMQKDELLGRRSGLTTRSALSDLKAHAFELFQHFMIEIIGSSQGAVSFQLASDISARTTARLMAKIYEQINPDALGQDFRDLNVAEKYGERLNMRFHNLKSDEIKRLVYGYPSHDFVIDLEEAKEVYERATLPTATLFNIIKARSSDLLIPRPGPRILVDMLTTAGLSISAEDGNATKSGTQTAANSPPVGGGGPRPETPTERSARRDALLRHSEFMADFILERVDRPSFVERKGYALGSREQTIAAQFQTDTFCA